MWKHKPSVTREMEFSNKSGQHLFNIPCYLTDRYKFVPTEIYIFKWFIPIVCNHKYQRYKVCESNTTILLWNTGSSKWQHVPAYSYKTNVITGTPFYTSNKLLYYQSLRWYTLLSKPHTGFASSTIFLIFDIIL